jgi:hypothetical protein
MEVISGNAEDVKRVVLSSLEPVGPDAQRDGTGHALYVMCTEDDLDDARHVQDHLFGAGFEVFLPAFEGDESELRADHRANLTECDGWVIYHRSGSEPWLRGKLRDQLKARGYGSGSGPKAQAILYEGDRAEQHVRRLRAHNTMLLQRDRVPDLDCLMRPFVTHVSALPPAPH